MPFKSNPIKIPIWAHVTLVLGSLLDHIIFLYKVLRCYIQDSKMNLLIIHEIFNNFFHKFIINLKCAQKINFNLS
jgi:hypothetical protein